MNKSLNAIRFILALGIFIVHLTFLSESSIGSLYNNYLIGFGAFGVTFFIILSGYFIGIKYYTHVNGCNNSFKNFIIKRIIKIYPLHIITFIIAIFVRIDQIIAKPLQYIIVGICNLFLIQTVFPDERIYNSFNSVSWFLSVIMICYILTPFLFLLLKKIDDKNINLFGLIGFLYIFQLIIVCLLKDVSIRYWLFYNSPFFRIFDYTIGLALGILYKQNKFYFKNIKFNNSILEVICILVTIITFALRTKVYVTFLYGAYYTPVIILSILIFGKEKGLVSKILSNRLLNYLGSISQEFYMIHFLTIAIVKNAIGLNNIIMIIVISFSATLILSILLKKLIGKIIVINANLHSE